MGKGIFMEWEFWRDSNTTLSEKAILLEIQNLSMLDKGCVAHNEHFSKLMGIKKEAVSRLINALVKKGYISSQIKEGSRNYSRTITINKLLFDPKQIVISPLTNCLETKENKTSNITFIEAIKKFSFIDEQSFDKLVEHLKTKYSELTKVRVTNNIKKLKSNPSLFSFAVDEMIRLDYNGLFIPSKNNNNNTQVGLDEIKKANLFKNSELGGYK